MRPNPDIASAAAPLFRPSLLIETARMGARHYLRERHLGASLSAAPKGQIVARLIESERQCETLRRIRSPAYRPGRHVQMLAALIAETGQTKASGSEALRLAT